jgi:hypothetical protein
MFDSHDLVPVKIGQRTYVTQQSICDFVDRLTAEATAGGFTTTKWRAGIWLRRL